MTRSEVPPLTALEEQLRRMQTIAHGALRAIDNRISVPPPLPPRESAMRQGQPTDTGRQKAWWEGYRQAIEEVAYFINAENAAATRLSVTGSSGAAGEQ